jgi:hypothetical protein
VDVNTGAVKVATNVAPNAVVKVTTSLREFDTLKVGMPFDVAPTIPAVN